MRFFAAVLFLDAVLAASLSSLAQTPVPAPDLVLWHVAVKPFTQTRSFETNSCDVIEGCMASGTRRLLRFHIETRNQGSADLVLGAPEGNPHFEYAECHGHYHFHNFVMARLFDSNNLPVAAAAKIGFCLEDSHQWDPNAAAQPRFNCEFQGMQRGWADYYWANLACQYIDITGVPGGEYVLELEIDPENYLPESNENNNLIRLPVVLPGPCEPVANDNFDAPAPITAARAKIFGNSNCATPEPGEAAIVDGLGRSVWFRWVAPFTGHVMISSDGTTFNSVIGVYTGDALDALATIGESDDGGTGYNGLVRFVATNGAVYRIKIDGNRGGGGDYTLNIMPSTNDHFRDCAPLLGPVGLIRDYSVYATAEPGEPPHAGNLARRSLWYCWTAPFTGPVTFDTTGTFFDTVLAVYIGSSLSALTLVAGNDNSEPPWITSRVTFNAISNTVYRIAIDGRHGFVGMVILRWGPPLRLSVSNTTNTLQLSTTGAPGDQYAIETSPDLQHWTLWHRAFNTNGTLLLNDSLSTTQRFYRFYLE